MPFDGNNQVIDVRYPADRILSFVESEFPNAAALIGEPNLAPIAVYYRSVAGRLGTITPCLMITERQGAQRFGDHIAGAIQIILEFFIDGGDTEQLVTDVSKYALVLEMILANLPFDIFKGGTMAGQEGRHQAFYLDAIETFYDQLRGATGNADAYRQILQMRATFQVKAAPQL